MWVQTKGNPAVQATKSIKKVSDKGTRSAVQTVKTKQSTELITKKDWQSWLNEGLDLKNPFIITREETCEETCPFSDQLFSYYVLLVRSPPFTGKFSRLLY